MSRELYGMMDENREEFPFIGGRNWRYKQEVSEVVADHLTPDISSRRITGAHVGRALRNVPAATGHIFPKAGSPRYSHPFVRDGIDWFKVDLVDDIALDAAGRLKAPMPTAICVNGWHDRQVFSRLGGDEVLWITEPARLPSPKIARRNSGQPVAGLDVSVSAAGMRNRGVGLYVETTFLTANEYIDFTDVLLLGKIDPDTGITETPYHRLADELPEEEARMYGGCRPRDGKLFTANRMAHFILQTGETET